MSGSDDQIVGGMCRTSDLTKPIGKLCDSLDLAVAATIEQTVDFIVAASTWDDVLRFTNVTLNLGLRVTRVP